MALLKNISTGYCLKHIQTLNLEVTVRLQGPTNSVREAVEFYTCQTMELFKVLIDLF